jgi:hypothetical protein
MRESIPKGTEGGGWRGMSSLAWRADERGSVTVMVVLSMTALLGLLALSIDLGALFNARSEAQRAADAAALAGASAFLEYQEDAAVGAARERALELATVNEVRNELVTAEEVSVWIDPDSSTVRAAVRREGVSTWFAGLLGINTVDIGAEATAWAGAAGAAQCVKPFAVPDMWEENNDDLNGNRIWDAGERWRYDPADGDRYARYSGPGSGSNETGYGSGWRNGQVDGDGRRFERDYGRRITVKVTSPSDAYVPSCRGCSPRTGISRTAARVSVEAAVAVVATVRATAALEAGVTPAFRTTGLVRGRPDGSPGPTSEKA